MSLVFWRRMEIMLREILKNNLEVPLIWIYNYIMLIKKDMKKELVVELNMVGEWWCRGERGIDEIVSEDVNFDKIRRVWDKWNVDEDESDSDEKLNSIEERILYGDGGFITTNDEKLYDKINRMRFFGMERK